MDLSKVPDVKKLDLCKKYFWIGFAFLPFVWVVNVIWFFKDAFCRYEFQQQKQIKKYVIYSGIGSVIWFIALVTWVTIFQVNRRAWGEFADNISFIIPLGTP